MNIAAHLADGLKPVVDLIYPPRCPLCGAALAEQGGLCTGCWSALEFPGEPACGACQRPMNPKTHGQSGDCRACQEQPPRHAGIVAATLYNDTSRQLVLNFKHGRKIALAALMARLMAARLPMCDPAMPAPLLVPVPLHRWRIWHRGFNQAAMLAGEIAKLGRGELLVDALLRDRRTPSLGGLGRAEREQVLTGAIAVRGSRANAIKGREVILVDDVLTSGATSNACVEALLAGGAQQVTIACFARVVSGAGMRQPA
jgi:ComF family protein